MPEPDETLDAPTYKPPKRTKSWVIALTVTATTAVALILTVAFGFIGWNKPNLVLRTRSVVDELDLACSNFRLENGRYPWAKPDSVTATTEIRCRDVYVELRGLPGAKINTTQDYFGEVKERYLKNGTVVDTWGHEITFRVDPATMKPVIWSCGRDGKDDTNDGVSPDPAKFPKTYYWFGSGSTGRISDDITNR